MSLIASLIGPVAGLLDKFVEDKDQRNALAHEIATMSEKYANEQVIAQLEVNKTEAAHKSLFVAGWRPFIGWVCGFGMTGNFIALPFCNFALALLEQNIIIPLVPLEQMMPVLMGMLGFGGLRTYEKVKGVQREK